MAGALKAVNADRVYTETLGLKRVADRDGLVDYLDAGLPEGRHVRSRVAASSFDHLHPRVQESPDTVSFVLGSPDGSTLPPALPGQYVSVQVALADGARQIRQYSLTHNSDPSRWAISVKAVPATLDDTGTVLPAGEVSNHLHHNLFEGDEIAVSAPFGDVVLDDSTDPLLLISAGIGITPIIGILHYLVGTDSPRQVAVVHADRSPAQHAHRQELKEIVASLPGATLHRWYEDLGVRPTRDVLHAGRVDLSALEIPAASQVYLCGPLPFMESVRSSLIAQDVAEADIHYEVFGPDTSLAPA